MRTRWVPVAGFTSLITSLALAVSCGARTGLPVPTLSEGGGGAGGKLEVPDAAPDVQPDVPIPPPPTECLDAGMQFIYLIGGDNTLWSFYPPNVGTAEQPFHLIGTIACPTDPRFTPFSMGVDRAGVAQVVFTDGNLYRVSTADASCRATPFISNQEGFLTFGMGFSANTTTVGDTLYVAEVNQGDPDTDPSEGLAWIDLNDYKLHYIGPFSQNPGSEIELTGTGDGRLFGYFIDVPGPGGHIVEIDKTSGDILSSQAVNTNETGPSSLAFAAYAGSFYVFTALTNSGVTTVRKVTPGVADPEIVATLNSDIVGAGVSTCAPSD